MMKSRRHIVPILVIILGLVLTACSKDNVELPSQPPEEQEDLTEQGQTLNVVVPEKMNETTEENGKYQIQTRLVDFNLLDENAGLAWGVTKKTLRLYRTEDNGVTWLNISPAANIKFDSNPKYGIDMFFLEKNNGWIIRNGQGVNETVVLRTTNGGNQWKISSLPKSDHIKGISFSSPARGWIMTSSATSMGKEEKYLYRTDDGGATWTKIMQNTGTLTLENDTMGSISNTGYLNNMTFVDGLNGFVTLQDKEVSELYMTEDGGNTWNTIPDFIDLNKMSACSTLSLGKPQFVTQSKRHGFMPLSCTKGTETKFNGYFTIDKGQSWVLAPFHLNWTSGLNQGLSPVFVSNSEGWHLQGSNLYHTVDQGKNWKALPISLLLQDYMDKYPIVVKMDFISSDVGWILLENSDKKRSLLLQTMNGGVSWKVL
ncbi:VPS10 domain-containing protein [Paenibacillus sp. FA6]|uniref:WD40/YVTN/BNR-like repeat-containing protein n=1 Tax=Paenibacillus sp. FA6 TaxID=3413029 RepID=UPI003F65C8C4